MRQQFGMNQKMQQRMIMTPMLQQAMKILQLSTLELKEWVEKEIMENPVLEEDDEVSPPETATDKDPTADSPQNPADEAVIPDDELVFEKMRQARSNDLVENLKDGGRFQNETWELYNEGAEYGEWNDGAWGGSEGFSAEQEKRDFVEASITRAQTLA
jgi:DNA-directed RNA polymerase specialized sigma54-like protein